MKRAGAVETAALASGALLVPVAFAADLAGDSATAILVALAAALLIGLALLLQEGRRR
jgi:hypothetical protein